MLLHCYKYDANLGQSPYQAKSLNIWGRKLFGESLPYLILESASKSIDWILKNKEEILKSRKEIPKTFDFKPEDVFSKKKLLLRCLKEAPKRIKKLKK